jgi:hypothetical protein
MSRKKSKPRKNRELKKESAQKTPSVSSNKPKAKALDSTTLALIAAQVAPKRFIKSKDAVNYAYQLWSDSKDLLGQEAINQAWIESLDEEAENAKLPERPGPYDLKSFLKHVVDGPIDNRQNRLTEFLKSNSDYYPSPDSTIQEWERTGFDREEWVNTAKWFRAWIKADLSTKQSSKGSLGYQKRIENRLKHIKELIENLKRDRLRPDRLTIKEFYKKIVEGKNKAVSEWRFMGFLEKSQPDSLEGGTKAGEELNRFKNHGFSVSEWNETALNYLNYRIKNVKSELSPNSRGTRR